MTNSKRIAGLLAAATIGALALAGCSTSGGSTAADAASSGDESITLTKDVHLVVGTSAQEGAVFTDSGIFDDAPYTIDWSYITDWGAIYSSIASDSLNVGYWGLDANIFKAVQNGVPAKLVSLLGADASAEDAGALNVFVRTDAGIDTTEDLKGTTISTGSAGTTFDNVLTAALSNGGLTEADVNVVRYPDSDQTSQINSLLDGDAQAFAGNITSEQIIDALDAGTIKVLYWQDQALPINRIVVSNDQTLGDPAKAAALEDFAQRVAQAQNWKNDPANKDKLVAITTASTKLPTAVAEKSYDYTVDSTVPLALDSTTTQKLEATIGDFVDFGLLTEPVEVSDVLDTRFADAIQTAIDSK
ncbi:MAG: hypothetical protein EPO52_01005 [Herbiconiux sp.]|uniref:ABC transporter substrate-binding protein n=1 Tax=Herbiconiux sp. TaxID=1871186 RepID=UPI0012193EBD|nr:ABC transporter substrate-binding protein [Herbiconiux sp.]TAJ50174.1 MAG: hypothetical protein EPO52_01005 [Herbiconiux sp.]